MLRRVERKEKDGRLPPTPRLRRPGKAKGLRIAKPATMMAGKLEEHPQKPGFEERFALGKKKKKEKTLRKLHSHVSDDFAIP